MKRSFLTVLALPIILTFIMSAPVLGEVIVDQLGVGINSPVEKLEVDGKIRSRSLRVTDGASTGRVLTSDATGNATWQTAPPDNDNDPINELNQSLTLTGPLLQIQDTGGALEVDFTNLVNKTIQVGLIGGEYKTINKIRFEGAGITVALDGGDPTIAVVTIAPDHTHANLNELNLVTDGNHDVSTTNPHGVTKANVGLGNVDDVQQIPMSQKGAANGVATLDGLSNIVSLGGKIIQDGNNRICIGGPTGLSWKSGGTVQGAESSMSGGTCN